MKLLIFFLLCATSLAAQTNNSYFLKYYYEQRSVAGIDSNSPMNLGSNAQINLKLNFYILANADSSRMFFNAPDSSNRNGVRMVMNTPDTIYYKDNKWTKILDGIIEPVQTLTLQLKETADTKKILGYDCVRFIDMSGNSSPAEYWVCKQLPKTILPSTGLTNFPYCILEISDPRQNIFTKATEIKRL